MQEFQMTKINKSEDHSTNQVIPIITPPIQHQLKMENAEPPSIHMQAQEAPIEQAHQVGIPLRPKDREYTALLDDETGDWYLVITDGKECFHLSENEAKRAASMLNEMGSNVITLYCRTTGCKENGAWLKRAAADVKKNVYFCEICKQPMVR